MSFQNRKKVIPSSEYSSLSVDEISETEDLIPHPDDPIKDMGKIYWRKKEGEISTTKMPQQEEEDNKIYLNENKNYIADGASISLGSPDENIYILKYREVDNKEVIDMMTAGMFTQ